METPNAQNILLEFDHELRPTGTVAVRDLGDSALYKPIAKVIGDEEALDTNYEASYYFLTKKLRPYGKNSFFHFDHAGNNSVSEKTIKKWLHQHNQAYINEIVKSLKLKESPRSIQELNALLTSKVGLKAIEKFQAHLRVRGAR